MNIDWEDWGPEAFARAKAQGKPVLLFLEEGRDDWRKAFVAPEGVEKALAGFVPVVVDCFQRPDVFGRYLLVASRVPAALVLREDGSVLDAGREPEALAARLAELARAYRGGGADAETVPAWTGAVGAPALKPLDPGYPAAFLAAVKNWERSTEKLLFVRPEAWDLLLYAASEWDDAEAIEALDEELAAHLGLWYDARNVSWLARLCWSRYGWDGDAAARERAAAYTALLRGELFDAHSGFFAATAQERGGPPFADINAMGALALLRASAFPDHAQAFETAETVLHNLQHKLYDPLLGMIHTRTPRTVVYGLLQDNAWTLLAFTEAFLMTGHKPYREFAGELGRLLFQEFWDRDGGGFLDRSHQRDDIGLLKNKYVSPHLNGLALEGIWRLSELKGNTNYKKWLKMALQRLTNDKAGAGEESAALARLQDMFVKGRMDLELVGSRTDPKTEELLAAVNRLHLPRKIVSFVDPNDQDYILAHKLEAASYPRLFACGPDLRPRAEADDPAQVAQAVAALR